MFLTIYRLILEVTILRKKTSDAGLWQSAIRVNAQTTQLHTENDNTYTVVTVPKQCAKPKVLPERIFIFQLKNKETLGIEMEYGVSFIFSGKFLTHRQVWNENKVSNETFFNFSSYGNERLYNYVKATITRVSEWLYNL